MAEGTTCSDPLVSLVYVSSGRGINEQEIRNILQVSRRNNEALGITGLLAYHDGNFLQVLEGPESAVRNKMQTIERDPRHSGLIVLHTRPVKDRLFADWSMAFRKLKDLSPDEEQACSPLLRGNLLEEKYKSDPNVCYRLLMTFKQNIR